MPAVTKPYERARSLLEAEEAMVLTVNYAMLSVGAVGAIRAYGRTVALQRALRLQKRLWRFRYS